MQLMCQIDLVMFPRKRKIASCCNTWQSCWFLSGSLLIFFLFSFQFYLLPEGWLFVLVWDLHGDALRSQYNCYVLWFISWVASLVVSICIVHLLLLAFCFRKPLHSIMCFCCCALARYCLVPLVGKGFHEYIRCYFLLCS